MKSWHALVCGGLIAVAVVLVALGGTSIAVMPLIGCALMMGAMMWMMGRGGSGGSGSSG